MKTYALIISIFVTIVLSSCEKTVNVKIPYEGDKIVLNAFMRQDSFIYAQVSKTVKLSQNNNFAEPSGASVQLYKNGIFVENMIAQTINGKNYFKSTVKATPNGIYTVKAAATGLTPVEGTDTLPTKANSTGISYTLVNSANNSNDAKLKVKINDPGGVRNYYMIRIFSADTNTAPTGPRYFIDNSKNYFTADITGGNAGGGILGDNEVNEALFTDEQFNGKEVVINITTYGYNYQNYKVVEVVALSKAAYRYIVSTNTQLENNGNPFAEATIIYNNITNGFGIVAGTAANVHILKKQ
jgi:Domain of unknown function (DUF4249)